MNGIEISAEKSIVTDAQRRSHEDKKRKNLLLGGNITVGGRNRNVNRNNKTITAAMSA